MTQQDEMTECREILKRLLAVDTCNPPGNEALLVDEIRKIVGYAGGDGVMELGGGRANLMLSLEGRGDAVIGFAGHLDTVPTGDPKLWSHPPFGGHAENGFVYGRGASDMRGGLAAMLMLYLHYKNSGVRPPAGLRFFFTADEESAGTGIAALRDRGWLDGLSQLFICEPTGCQPGVAEKGAIWLDVRVTGRSCHAAIPEEGINALEYGLRYMESLKATVEALPGHSLLGACTCSVTRACAGIKTNTIPETAEFSADIRIGPDIDGGALIETASRAARRLESERPGLKIETEVTNNRPALGVPDDSPLLARLRGVFAQLGLRTQPAGIRFYTDASLVIPGTELPFVILGPGEQAECHRIDEKIELASVVRAWQIYRAYVESFA